MMRTVTAVVVVAVVLVACSDTEPVGLTTSAAIVETTAAGDPVATTTVPATQPPGTLPDPGAGLRWYGELRVPEVLEGFSFGPVWLDGDELVVGVADAAELRRRGLMFVADLGDLDGMIFIFGQDTAGGFWMKDTLIPLDIAFFDAAGKFVDGFAMEPCVTDDCPSYQPAGAYRYALEVPAGSMPDSPESLSLEEPAE
jgi:uncharacterized membrane protein (UPF0127 family)